MFLFFHSLRPYFGGFFQRFFPLDTGVPQFRLERLAQLVVIYFGHIHFQRFRHLGWAIYFGFMVKFVCGFVVMLILSYPRRKASQLEQLEKS